MPPPIRPDDGCPDMRTALTVIVLIGLLAASAGVAYWVWLEIGEVEISGHGLIALGLGVVVTFVLGTGLMTLVFLSNRRGYDSQAHQHRDTPRPRRDDRSEP